MIFRNLQNDNRIFAHRSIPLHLLPTSTFICMNLARAPVRPVILARRMTAATGRLRAPFLIFLFFIRFPREKGPTEGENPAARSRRREKSTAFFSCFLFLFFFFVFRFVLFFSGSLCVFYVRTALHKEIYFLGL